MSEMVNLVDWNTEEIPVYGQEASPSNSVYRWNEVNVFEKPPSKRFSFFKKNTTLTSTNTKHILKNVYGEACPGELLAILGPSGAGKTTLLDTLTFNVSRGQIVLGARFLGSQPLDASMLSSMCGYVHQYDRFFCNLTVREHLIFQSMVRMQRDLSYKQRLTRVDEVIVELGLSKCQHTAIGSPESEKGISGGEMRRLSFASETLTDPQFMFCDEPTSGLDSYTTRTVVQILKNLARKGKTVICTIHQPSSEIYRTFDKLLLMAEGRVAFLGSLDQASAFFDEIGYPCPIDHNPAEFYVKQLSVVPSQERVSRKKLEKICDNFQQSENAQRLKHLGELFSQNINVDIDDQSLDESISISQYKVSWFAQFKAVLWRSWLNVIRNEILARMRILQGIIFALLMGLIFFGQKLDQEGVFNINGALFMAIMESTIGNITAVIDVFTREIPIFLKENRFGMYRTDVYFISKTLVELPVIYLTMTLFMVIFYNMVGLRPEVDAFFRAILIVLMTSTVATSFGYMISCVSRSLEMSMLLLQMVFTPLALLGGFFMNVRSVPGFVEWLSNLSWLRYGFEALIVNQWAGISNITCNRVLETCPHTGEDVMSTLNFSEENFLPDILYMLLIEVFFTLVAFFALLSQTYSRN